jgi:magnesium chelatase subunit I
MSAAPDTSPKVHALPDRQRPRPPFPFSAIVGQEEMKRALVLTAIDPSIGGVLVFGDRGTGKSTAVRALAALLPEIEAVEGCPVNSARNDLCPDWVQLSPGAAIIRKPTPVVDLPLGVSEDRVVGALDIERAIARGEKTFEPGLLARANRGYLYIDEVNLLEDHIVDLLLDVAQSGENVVERDGLSIRHAARFVLVGSGNPEEGELRPQLLDRFGLSVEVTSPRDIATRVEVIMRRDAYETDPDGFLPHWQAQDAALRAAILTARRALPKLKTPGATLHDCAALCIEIGSDGLRGELTLLRAARALAAFERSLAVGREHLKAVAAMALGHRLRRDPLDEAGSVARIARAVTEILP